MDSHATPQLHLHDVTIDLVLYRFGSVKRLHLKGSFKGLLGEEDSKEEEEEDDDDDDHDEVLKKNASSLFGAAAKEAVPRSSTGKSDSYLSETRYVYSKHFFSVFD